MATTIYIELLAENLDAWAPVQAEAQPDGTFRLPAPAPDDKTCCVNHSAAGQNDGERAKRLVLVAFYAARHATGKPQARCCLERGPNAQTRTADAGPCVIVIHARTGTAGPTVRTQEDGGRLSGSSGSGTQPRHP
jgi:hypothetical protein